MDRACASEAQGRRFESARARHPTQSRQSEFTRVGGKTKAAYCPLRKSILSRVLQKSEYRRSLLLQIIPAAPQRSGSWIQSASSPALATNCSRPFYKFRSEEHTSE